MTLCSCNLCYGCLIPTVPLLFQPPPADACSFPNVTPHTTAHDFIDHTSPIPRFSPGIAGVNAATGPQTASLPRPTSSFLPPGHITAATTLPSTDIAAWFRAFHRRTEHAIPSFAGRVATVFPLFQNWTGYLARGSYGVLVWNRSSVAYQVMTAKQALLNASLRCACGAAHTFAAWRRLSLLSMAGRRKRKTRYFIKQRACCFTSSPSSATGGRRGCLWYSSIASHHSLSTILQA